MTPRARERLLDWVAAGAVAEIVFVVFVRTLRGDFVSWDDDVNFLDNPSYRGLGPTQLRWMFTSLRGVYVPVTWVTLGLDHVLWGMRPVGYHLTSVLFHAANAVVAYVLARRLLVAAVPGAARTRVRLAAALAALLFAVHPLRVESVAWITERRDVVSGLFFLLAIVFYLRATDGERLHRAWYGAAVGAAALAVFAKAIAVTLPLVLILLDVYPLRRRRAWYEKLPFVALGLAAAVVAVVAQRASGSLSGLQAIGPAERLGLSAYALVFYAWKTVAPVGLSPLYEMPFDRGPWAPTFGASAALVVAAGAALWLGRRRWPGAAAAGAAFTVMLLPVLGLVHFGSHYAADRNTYVAGVAPAMLAAGGVLRCGRAAAAAVAAVVLAVLATLTAVQTTVWHDSETLWRHALRVSPSATAHFKLASLLDDAGEWEAALPHYRGAVRIHPDFPMAYNNWGITLARLGRLEEAQERFRTALRLRPDFPEAQRNLNLTLHRRATPPPTRR